MGETFLFWLRIEGHDSQAAWFQSIQKHEDIAYFLLNIEGNVLQSAEMKESL